MRRVVEPFALVAIVVAAAGLRLWALDTQPGGLYPDEAAEAYDAHRLLHTPGFHPVFFQDDAGREPMYGYLVALAFRLSGESTTVLRATSAVIGVLAVVAVYFWLRRRGAAVALGGAAWAAGSLWLLCVSRDGMRNVLVPVIGALALWAMSSWADRPSRKSALVAGAAMALGLWTYQPLKLLPVLLAAWLLWLRAEDGRRYQALRPLLGWLALAYIVVGGPMIYTAATDPFHYFGRALAVTVGGQAASGLGLIEHTIRTLLMFPLTGDPNQLSDVRSLPLLGLPLTVLVAAGARAAWHRRAQPLESLLLLSVPIFLLPPLVATADAAPHFLRSLGLAAPVAGLIGLGAAEMIRIGRSDGTRRLIAGAIAVLLAALAAGSGTAYFSRPVSARYDAYSFPLVQLAGAVGPERLGERVVLLDYYQATDIRFLRARELAAGTVIVVDPRGGSTPPPHSQSETCAVFALSPEDVARVYGTAVASNAITVARDPRGAPSVWRAAC